MLRFDPNESSNIIGLSWGHSPSSTLYHYDPKHGYARKIITFNFSSFEENYIRSINILDNDDTLHVVGFERRYLVALRFLLSLDVVNCFRYLAKTPNTSFLKSMRADMSVYSVGHHEAHAAHALTEGALSRSRSMRSKLLIITADSIGELDTVVLWEFCPYANKINRIFRERWPFSLGVPLERAAAQFKMNVADFMAKTEKATYSTPREPLFYSNLLADYRTSNVLTNNVEEAATCLRNSTSTYLFRLISIYGNPHYAGICFGGGLAYSEEFRNTVKSAAEYFLQSSDCFWSPKNPGDEGSSNGAAKAFLMRQDLGHLVVE